MGAVAPGLWEEEEVDIEKITQYLVDRADAAAREVHLEMQKGAANLGKVANLQAIEADLREVVEEIRSGIPFISNEEETSEATEAPEDAQAATEAGGADSQPAVAGPVETPTDSDAGDSDTNAGSQ